MRSRLQLGLIAFAAVSSERSYDDRFDAMRFERETLLFEQHAFIAVRGN